MTVLREQLLGFAAYLRDARAHPPPEGVPETRLAVYRALVANNLRTLLGGNFPVMRRTLGEANWSALVREFQASHCSGTPLFTRVGGEFVDFLQARQPRSGDPEWLAELAHYEWVELALQIADDAVPAHDPAGDLLACPLVVSPFAWTFAYRWPVHLIGPENVVTAPPSEPTLLLLRRATDGQVRFSLLSPPVYQLLAWQAETPDACGHALLSRLADAAHAEDRDAFLAAGAHMLQRLHDEGTVLGTRSG